MSNRARLTILSCIGGVAAIVAVAFWLGSRSDAVLARWSAVAGVISGVVTVLALAVALVPLWHRDDGREGGGRGEPKLPGSAVMQNIRGNGSVNVVGKGSQVNMDLRLPPSDGR